MDEQKVPEIFEETREATIDDTTEILSVDKNQETEKTPGINPDDPLDDISMENLRELIKEVGNSVKLMKEIWMATQREFHLTKDHMQQLQKYNSDHLTQLKEDATKEEEEAWDRFNGIDSITEEDVEKIFGKEHDIIGVDHEITVSRIKDAMNDLYAYTYATYEFNNVYNGYMQLQETEEEKKVQELREIADQQTDPDLQQKMYAELDKYYYRKRLKFLADPDIIDNVVKNRIANALKDENKIDYWMNRSRDKLKRMGISPTSIMQVWNFEKRFLDEKYHRIDNILETYFLSICTYCKPDEPNDRFRNMVVCMVFAIDQIVRKIMPEDIKQEVMHNIITFEEMMLEYIKE